MINKGKHVYQGLKPAVITLSEVSDEIKAEIQEKARDKTPEWPKVEE